MDFLTKKAQGFAFVTYVFAENAVKAFTELDGKSFQVDIIILYSALFVKKTKTSYLFVFLIVI